MTHHILNGINGINGFHSSPSESETELPSPISSNGGNSSDNSTTNGVNGTASLLTNGTGINPVRRRMDRKKSSPMMPPFMVSAPGKVIVFGEHSVVHGKVSRTESRREAQHIHAQCILCRAPLRGCPNKGSTEGLTQHVISRNRLRSPPPSRCGHTSMSRRYRSLRER